MRRARQAILALALALTPLPAAAQSLTGAVTSAVTNVIGSGMDLSSVMGALGITGDTPLSDVTSALSFDQIELIPTNPEAVCIAESTASGMPGDILSTQQVALTQLGLQYILYKFQDNVVSAVNGQGQAMNAVMAAASDRANQIAANSLTAKITAAGQMKALDVLAGMPAGGTCNWIPGALGQVLAGADAAVAQLVRMLQYGMPVNPADSHMTKQQLQARKADFARDNLMLFPASQTFTPDEFDAAIAYLDLLYPQPAPLPAGATAEQAIRSSAARQKNALLSQGLREFAVDRAPTIPGSALETIGQGYVPIQAGSTPSTDPSTHASIPAATTLANVSKQTFLRAVADRYSSAAYSKDILGLNAEGLAKEKSMLDAYVQRAFLDIRAMTALRAAMDSAGDAANTQ
jgi:hypothetical protein